MSKTETAVITTKTVATVAPVKGMQMVEVLGPNDRPQGPDTMVRISAPGMAPVDGPALMHANNMSKSLAKSAGRIAYRMACIAAGFPDPEAKQ